MTESVDQPPRIENPNAWPSAAEAPDAGGQPKPQPVFAGKARDLGALRDAVVDAAGVGTGLWFSYLFVLFYLLVSVGGVTHGMLLFEEPVKLPILAVDLPLGAFFVVGPALFIVVHAYVLLHFVLLAGKVGSFHSELVDQIEDDDTRTRLRRQLPSNIFAQFLAGPREVREGVVGFLLRLIAFVSLIVAPVMLLVLFLAQFLPYQDEVITWWHRVALVVDLALLWFLWPSIVSGQMSTIGWVDLRRPKIMVLAIASIVPVLFVVLVAVFPGEWLDEKLPRVAFMSIGTDNSGRRWVSLHELLFAGPVDEITRRPTSLWSNRLVLPGLDLRDNPKFDSDAKIASLPHTVVLRGRRLNGAVFSGANLQKADLAGAQLQGAWLRGVSLAEATLHNTRLDGADLTLANLQSSDLKNTSLVGASLFGANLQGANIADANFTAAMLLGANLQFASIERSRFQGAKMESARLEGARIRGTDLSAVSLMSAVLHGASISGGTLRGVDLTGACLWRMHLFAHEKIGHLASPDVEWSRKDQGTCSNYATYEQLQERIRSTVPPNRRAEVERRISLLDCAHEGAPCDPLSAMPRSDTREKIEAASVSREAYVSDKLAGLADIACNQGSNPEVLPALRRRLRFLSSYEKPATAAQTGCPAFAKVWHEAFGDSRGGPAGAR